MQEIQRIALQPPERFYQEEEICGGVVKTEPEDFVVTEEPLYPPSGEGDHLFIQVLKRDVDHETLLRRLVKALDVSKSDIGYAGTKDRRAITQQWLSVPRRAEAAIDGFEDPAIEIRQVIAHPHKLRRGHLKHNRFDCLLRGARKAPSSELIQRLMTDGVPNFYDAQRFGKAGSTALAGLKYLRGDVKKVSSRSLLRLQISAVQSLGFNHVLRARIADGLLHQPLLGDLAQVRQSGGIFWVDDVKDVEARLAAEELSLTGPMLGAKVKLPRAEAGDYERMKLEELGLRAELFEGMKKLAPGSRRPLCVRPSELHVSMEEAGLRVKFSLPPGAYATLILREFTGTSVELTGPA